MSRNSLKNVIRLIEDVKKAETPEQGFLIDLKRSIEITATKSKKKGSLSYKPSSMNCLRQMYYIKTGQAPDEDGENYIGIGICAMGSETHQRIQQAVCDMKRNGIDCEYINVGDYIKSRELDYLEIVEPSNFKKGKFETKLFHKNLEMSFLCDGIIKYKGIYYILELKTESANKFFTRQGVDKGHYNQGTAYSLALQIPNVIFVYISRDIPDMKSFIFTPTDELKQELVGKIQTCEQHIANFKVPDKPKDVENKTCAYCQFKERCKKDG